MDNEIIEKTLKMRANTFIIVLFLMLFNVSLYSQEKPLDDLLQRFNTIDAEASPAEALGLLKKIYDATYVNQPQLTTEYIARAIFICDSIVKDTAQSIKWKERLAILYLGQDKLDQAMRYTVEAKNYYQSHNDSLNLAFTYNHLGDIYYKLNVPEISEQEYDNAIEIFKKHEELRGLVDATIQKSKILYDDYNVNKAFELLFDLHGKIQDVAMLADLNKAIGVLYTEDKPDSANYYLSLAISDYKKVNNLNDEADCYLELGKLNIEEEGYDLAEDYLKKSLAIYSQNKSEYRLLENKKWLGYLAFLRGNFKKSEQLFVEISNNFIATNSQKLFAFEYLAEIYAKQKQQDLSNVYLNKYIDLQNIDFEQKAKQGYAEVILSFQNEEKQKAIELLEKEDALKSQQLKNKQQQLYGFALVVVLLVAFAVFLFYFIQKQKRVNKLLQERNREINLQKKEIETQSRILEKATRNLVKQKDEIQNKNKKITSSIEYASRIQKSMLATNRIFDKYFADHFILFKPKEKVSGDFYWISELNEQKLSLFSDAKDVSQKLVVAVIDCTGHGVPGAFMSMLGDAFLNQIINVQRIFSPERILEELHKAIRTTLQQEHTDNKDGMDAAICVIDKKSRTLDFAGAKNPLIYIQNGNINRIQGDLMSIGGLQKEKQRLFTKHTIDITAKTYLYMFSDGYQDQFGGEYGRKYMAKPFRELLFENHQKPFAEQNKILLKVFKDWRNNKYSQMDDVTVIGFTF